MESRVHISGQWKTNASKFVLTVILLAVAVIMILPFIWMLSTSFKNPIEVFNYPIEWIPSSFQFENYRVVWFGPDPFWVYYWNSIKVSFFTVVGTVIVSSAAAYGFSRIQFKGRDAVFLLHLATLMIPDQATLVPRFIIFNYLGIYNSHLALILPGIFFAFNIFLLRQFYLTIPRDFSEAAQVEGASHFKIWTTIIMPLSKPALVSLIILSFTWNWNEFVNPLVFLPSKELATVPLGLTNFVDETGTDYPSMMAAAVSSIFPVVVLFFACQRWFVEGVMSSGIKG